jgi:membrane protein
MKRTLASGTHASAPAAGTHVSRLAHHVGRLTRWIGPWLPVRVMRRVFAMDGKAKAFTLAAQTFTGIFPLLVVIASIGAQPDDRSRLAVRLTHMFRLEGNAAAAVETLFSQPQGDAEGIGAVGAVLLVFSLFALARSLQRIFEVAWMIRSGGLSRTWYGLAGTVLFVADIAALTTLGAVLRRLPGGAGLAVAVQVLGSFAFWMILQYLLLSRQISWRPLLPGAVVAAAGQVLIILFSATYMPNQIATNSARYGIVGVSLALLTWLIVVAAVVVAVAATGAELAGRPQSAQLPGPIRA